MAYLTRPQRIERWLEAGRTGKVKPEHARIAVRRLREKIITEKKQKGEAA